MKFKLATLLFILFITLTKTASSQRFSVYVSASGNDNNSGTEINKPFATLEKARDEVRKFRKNNSSDTAFIFLKQGEISLTQTFALNEEDSNPNGAPTIFTSAPGERAIVNGGRKIAGWKKFKNNIYVAELPDVKTGKWRFSQLFVNGESRKRTRLPKKGFYRVTGFPDGGPEVSYQTDSRRFQYKAGDIRPDWKNLKDIEVIVYHFWTDTHLPIESVDDKSHIVTFQYPSGKVFTDDFNKEGARYVVENVWEGLQDPGDWYLDRKAGKLFYIPLPGEDMRSAEVWAPAIRELVSIDGNALNGKFASNIQFRNIHFRFADGQLPPGDNNNSQGSSTVSAAINLIGVQNIVFDNCIISDIGGYAFDIKSGSSYNSFTYNKLMNIAAGGFKITGGTFNDHPLLQTHHNNITDNEIGPYGLFYPSAVGVLLMHTRNNHVLHNHIHHGFYTGVSVGWVWGYQRSVSRDNIIAYNHIHHIGQGLLSDMGGIYTLGVSPGTILNNNLIHDVDANNYGGWGIYNDEGSTHILVENNIVYNTKFAGYNINYAKEITVRNNIFAFGRLQQLSRNQIDPHKSVYFENNIVYWKQGPLLDENWKDNVYSFYYMPGKNGLKQDSSTFDMDYNIYFNPTRSLDSVNFNHHSWKEWQRRGKDVHSLYSDPLFVNADKFDFTLKEGSPAIQLGFRPIKMDSVGIRKSTGVQ